MMVHRGPDAGGTWTGDRAGLAFRRLAILDLSPHGDQPMSNETGDVVVVYNGEIYDFAALRAKLQQKHVFRSLTDTEVLVHGYEEWGLEGLLQRIDGMFAFAVWDARTQDLFLARDRVGKKPLYYHASDKGIAFASTLNALLELLPERPQVDVRGLDEYLVYQAVPAPRTIYTGVQMLPPAHWLRWSDGEGKMRPEVHRYWSLSYANKIHRRDAELLEELDGIVRCAVERRMVADVALGAFLSGGVDSGIVVGMMSSLGFGPVEAVHIGFDDPAYDERSHARVVAQKWGAHLHEHVMPVGEVSNLPQIIWHYGQPMADVSIVPSFALARAAREHVTVVLNGDGGDEAFAGYSRPIVARAAARLRGSVPRMLMPLAQRVAGRMGRRGQMLARAASTSARDAFVYDRGMRDVRASLYAPQLLARLGTIDPDENYHAAWDAADGLTDADRVLYGELTTYLPDQLLVKMDVSTMAHSLEARSPLLDVRLLEFAASIPVSQLTRGYQTKYLLKKLAERYIPPEVIYRRKRGFVMPVSQWLRGPLAKPLRHILEAPALAARNIFRPEALKQMVGEHLCGRRDWGSILWTALVLEVWFRLFVDQSITRNTRLEEIG